MLGPIPEKLFLDGVEYTTLQVRPGVRKWDTQEVPSQPGDGGKETVYPIEMHGGFGASRRFLDGANRVSDPTHHSHTQNWLTHIKGVGAPAPRITYIDLSSGGSRRSTGFRFGGTKAGQLGGGSGYTSLGGGSYVGSIAAITEFGNYLYCSGGINTFTIDPSTATPALKETRQHPQAGSRALSSEVFDARLLVALGEAVDADTARAPYDTGLASTPWASISDVRMDVFTVGGGGRLFSAKHNLVFNVLPGVDPTLAASYLPPAGEPITDDTDHIHALAEYARGLVASGHLTLRTFDPDAGFVSRALLPAVRAAADDYHGRGLTVIGETMFYATSRAVWMLVPGQRPERIGPELMLNNDTPYKGGQPGVPCFDGEVLYWPYYYPTTGDSVIWRVAPRQQGEPGTGPFVWSEFLYLASRECRCVAYWGGDATYKPRLFFGAGTTATPQQVGWVQLGRGGAADLFESGSVPALSAVAYGAIDDFARPAVVREVVRLEIPSIKNASATNYLAVAISDDDGATYKNLVKTNVAGASNDERITATGFAVVYADVATPSIPAGRTLQVRYTATQASGATTHLQMLGTPQLFVLERPATVEQVTTLLRFEQEPMGLDDVETAVNRLKALVAGAKVQMQHGPGDLSTYYVKVTDARSVEEAVQSGAGDHSERIVAMQVTLREVATGL